VLLPIGVGAAVQSIAYEGAFANGITKLPDESSVGSYLFLGGSYEVNLGHFLLDRPEEPPTDLGLACSSDLLESIDSPQRLEFCLSKPTLLVPDPSLEIHRATQIVCVVGDVRPRAIDVFVDEIDGGFSQIHLCQGVMNPKQVVVHVERGSELEGCLVMADGLPFVSLGTMCIAKETVAFADPRLLALIQGEIDRAGSCFFCRLGLTGLVQHEGEETQTLCLSRWVTKPFADFQRFSRLSYPFVVEVE